MRETIVFKGTSGHVRGVRGGGSATFSRVKFKKMLYFVSLEDSGKHTRVKLFSEEVSRMAEEKKNTVDFKGLYPTKAIAQLFNVDPRRIQQLTKEEVLHGTKVKGKLMYVLDETISTYIEHLSNKAHGRGQTETILDLKEQKLKAEIALKESQGELHRLKTDIAAGKYISVDEVKADYIRFFIEFKSFALSLPSRISARVDAYCSPTETRKLETELNADICKKLEEFIVLGAGGYGRNKWR